MTSPHEVLATDRPNRPWEIAGLAFTLFCCFWAYHDSFSAPMGGDDNATVINNPNIRSVWPLSRSMGAPANNPLTARPVVSLTFAFNYMNGGLEPFGYHVVNFLIHGLATLAFYFLVRWLLSNSSLKTFGQDSQAIALCSTMLWTLHPLHTETVVYLSQRTELLASLFLLLTLLFASMSWKSWTWGGLSIISCGLAMGSKEIVVSTPILVVLLDLAFYGDRLQASWRRRAWLYVALCLTWGVLAACLATTTRVGSVGTHHGVSTWEYLQLQSWTICRYLRLAVWPVGQSTDYGLSSDALGNVPFMPGAAVVVALIFATLFAWVRCRPLAFLGTVFFFVLAPTSSFLPIYTEFAAERRMYLPLMCVIAAFVGFVFWVRQRIDGEPLEYRPWLMGGLVVLACVLTYITARRTQVYNSKETVWADAVEKGPWNTRAYFFWAQQIQLDGRPREALQVVRECVSANPNNALAHVNLGRMLVEQNQFDQAFECYKKAYELNNQLEVVHFNLGIVMMAKGDFEAAEPLFERTLELDSDNKLAHYNLGNLQSVRDPERAIEHFRQAIEDDLRYGQRSRRRLAETLASMGKHEEALKEFRNVTEWVPADPKPWIGMGKIAIASQDYDLARSQFETAHELAKTDSQERDSALQHLNVVMALRKLEESPNDTAANKVMASYYIQDQPLRALKHMEVVLRQNPGDFVAWYQTGVIQLSRNKTAAAKNAFQAALAINPKFSPAQQQLDNMNK